ncbi:FAD-binding domain-containing protein [Paxillus ammoniavirescens]|nr:FAD-binding domain-containing protein [Paxillus ammoniavirescens]
MIPRSIHPCMLGRATDKLKVPLRSHLTYRFTYSTGSNPGWSRSYSAFSTGTRRQSWHKEAVRVGQFVVGSFVSFGIGFYAFGNGAFDGFIPLTMGTAHNASDVIPSSDEDHLVKHVYHQSKTDDSQPDSQLGSGSLLSSLDTPLSLSSSFGTAEDVEKAIEELRHALPGERRVQTNRDILELHGSSENSYHPSSPHSVVVRVRSTEDVVKVVNISRKYKVPIVPYSGATSLEGHFSGYSSGSICIDMSAMDQILEINEADGDLRCQAGARWEDINRTLNKKGIPLFFPLDPGPGATIGGMIGTGCSGTNAVRYGTAKAEWFLNITVVLPSGKVIKTRQRARKSSAGFDTTKLFIGAEGTLGIVTEATLRLAPWVPTKVAMAQFQNVEKAVSAVQEILNTPYGPHIQCVELLDDHMMSAINTAGIIEQPYPTKEDLAKAGLKSTIVGHVGDGNFHALILFRDEKELKSVSEAVHRLIHRAIEMDGTCTGEHGVGIGKTEYLVKELGEDTVELMKTVKRAIDPLNLFNPGKLYPRSKTEEEIARSH